MRIDQRVVPLCVDLEILVSQKRRSVAPHRQQQRGRQLVVRQRLAVGESDAPRRPLAARMFAGEIGLVPGKIEATTRTSCSHGSPRFHFDPVAM